MISPVSLTSIPPLALSNRVSATAAARTSQVVENQSFVTAVPASVTTPPVPVTTRTVTTEGARQAALQLLLRQQQTALASDIGRLDGLELGGTDTFARQLNGASIELPDTSSTALDSSTNPVRSRRELQAFEFYGSAVFPRESAGVTLVPERPDDVGAVGAASAITDSLQRQTPAAPPPEVAAPRAGTPFSIPASGSLIDVRA